VKRAAGLNVDGLLEQFELVTGCGLLQVHHNHHDSTNWLWGGLDRDVHNLRPLNLQMRRPPQENSRDRKQSASTQSFYHQGRRHGVCRFFFNVHLVTYGAFTVASTATHRR